ncbi:hypothetical protein LSAT2_020485 [Lamellibrachia satsuma]|nr:hypothetical protein LSAT2_020485 [Lamellibrachia satsuma]
MSITAPSTTGEQLPVIKLPEERLDELFRLQRRLAEVEKPVYAAFGEDEFTGFDGFQALVDSGDTLVAIDGLKSDAIDSFVCVVPSVFARYYNAAVADVFVGVDSAQASAGVFRKWIDIATAHARKAGYVTVLVQTFVTNVAAFSDLRNAGFEFCAVLPTSGRVRGVGLTDCVLWRKYVADRSTCDFSVRRVPRDECWYFGPARPRQDIGLPKRYTLKDGSIVEWDNLHSDDIDIYCGLFVDASARGEGYTADETDPEVTRHFIESETVVCMTFKTVDTGEVVGAGLLLPATCSRTTTPIVSSGAMVVRPDFGAKGLGSVMMELWPTLSVSCGYDAVYGESHTKHTAVLHMAVKEGLRVIGCIPGTINLPTSGWGDTVVFYKPFGRYMKASNL